MPEIQQDPMIANRYSVNSLQAGGVCLIDRERGQLVSIWSRTLSEQSMCDYIFKRKPVSSSTPVELKLISLRKRKKEKTSDDVIHTEPLHVDRETRLTQNAVMETTVLRKGLGTL